MKTGRFVIIGIAVLAMLALTWVARTPEPAQSAARLLPAGEAQLQVTPQPTEEAGELGEEADELGEPEPTEAALSSGLDKLDSFRSEVLVSWSGVRAFEEENGTKVDKQVEGFFNIKSAYVRQPPAYEMHMESSGMMDTESDEISKFSYIQVGDTAWMYQSESDSWMQMAAGTISLDEFMGMTPTGILPGLDARLKEKGGASTQDRGGIKCYNYSFTEKDIPQGTEGMDGVNSASGEMCIAVEGDYIVNFSFSADITNEEGENPMFDKGSLKIEYKVFDVNQPIVIEPPAEALAQKGAREDIPMTADAKIEFSMPGMVSYKTALSVSEVAQFYETEMPKQGWKLSENGKTTMEDMVILNFTKGKDQASVMINKAEEGEGTSVMITVQSE